MLIIMLQCSAIAQNCSTLKTRILTLFLHFVCSDVAQFFTNYFNVNIHAIVQCYSAILQFTENTYFNIISTLCMHAVAQNCNTEEYVFYRYFYTVYALL